MQEKIPESNPEEQAPAVEQNPDRPLRKNDTIRLGKTLYKVTKTFNKNKYMIKKV